MNGPGFDVIGDVHGAVGLVEGLLEHLGYRRVNGAYRHPHRQAIFVGDLIDRDPDGQLDTIRLVRSMADAGSAQVVLGNHEFNAVAYATESADGAGYCRPHNDKNTSQHRAFVDAVGFGTALHREVLDWFTTIPLWLDLGDLRVVHACWSEADIDVVRPMLGADNTLTEEFVVEASRKGSAAYRSLENLLKGPEISMGDVTYVDHGGRVRSNARARWWDPNAVTLRDIAVVPGGCVLSGPTGALLDELPLTEVPIGEVPLYADEVPVVVGHYWFTGELAPQSDYVACVDYSAAAGGPLVAYRWAEGDQVLRSTQMIGFR